MGFCTEGTEVLVKSLRLTNFKKFSSYEFQFNDDVNVFVGDNNAGKSTILEALEIVLNSNHRGRPFNSEFSPDLFNANLRQPYQRSLLQNFLRRCVERRARSILER